MKNTVQMLTIVTISVTVIIAISVGCRYDGLVQVKLGRDGGQLTIDGRRQLRLHLTGTILVDRDCFHERNAPPCPCC